MKQYLTPTLLNAADFSAFGEVVDTSAKQAQIINSGYAQKFSNVVALDANENEGRSALHIYIAKKRHLPLTINMLEKHPHFSQTFIPQSTKPFLCVVAPPADTPDVNQIRAFITNGKQGVHYQRNTWHFPLISLTDEALFFVIDRMPNDDIEQCIENPLKSPLLLTLGESND